MRIVGTFKPSCSKSALVSPALAVTITRLVLPATAAFALCDAIIQPYSVPGIHRPVVTAAAEHHRTGAEVLHRRHIVANEQHRPPLPLADFFHLFPNTSSETPQSPTASTSSTIRISGLQVGGHRESQTDVHAAAISLHRRVQELLHLGKGHDLVELLLDLRAASSPGSRRSGKCSPGRSTPDGIRSRPPASSPPGRIA